jgi:hypothetical protein
MQGARRRLSAALAASAWLHLAAATLTGPATAGATAAPAGPTVADTPFCGQIWGSLPEAEALRGPQGAVTDVRAGRHDCFDRVVIDLRGPAQIPFYDVRYVPTVAEQGSGHPVPLGGGAALQVIVG